MTDATKPGFRIEHDTMGEVEVPADALYRAQTQRAVENFPISGTAARAQRTSRRSPGSRRPPRAPTPSSACCPQDVADAIVAAADEVASGAHDDAVPDRRVPDRLGHVVEHEHERGARHARHPSARPRRAPQRPRQRLAVVQRRVPDLGARRRDGRRRPRPHPGARAPRRRAARQGRRVGARRQVRPHPPHGRHPGDPRPGVRRLRRRRAARRGAAWSRPCRGPRRSRSAARRSAPGSTPRPASRSASSSCCARTPGCR